MSTSLKLSESMVFVLLNVCNSKSKEIVPIGGGYWSIDGEKLEFSGDTKTIYALATRGLLVKSSLPGAPDWKSKYMLTENGKQVAEAIADGEGS
jgi:hypothetical protein